MCLIGNGPFGLFTLSHASFTIEHMFETLAEDAASQTEEFSEAFARLNRLRGRCRRAFVEAAVEDSAVGAGSGSAVASGSGSADLVPFGFGPSLATLQLAIEGFARCGVPADGGALVALRSELDRLCALVAEAEVRFDVGEVAQRWRWFVARMVRRSRRVGAQGRNR